MMATSSGFLGRDPHLEEIEQILKAADDGSLAALLLVSLHGVRAVNRELGYTAGDRLLELVLSDLKTILRDQDRITRVGSEFVIFLPSLVSTAQGIMAAQRVLSITERLLDISGNSVRPHLDIGIAFHPDHADSSTDLLRCADLALGEARRRHIGYWIYEPDAVVGLHGPSVALEGELAGAIAAGELSVHYQPQVDTRSGHVCGLEALLRWQSATRGAVSPAEFIPVAESSGLIRDITDWVLNTALRETQELRSQHENITLAVNLSATVLHDPETVGLISRAMKLWDVPDANLTLEITESSMMADPEASRRTMEKLAALGMGVAIDDFGTGYSSLAYLTGLPCTELKIDRTFVMKMMTDETSETIVRAVTNLAHTLKLAVVAEGVETEAALSALDRLGCDKAQGFLIGRPMPIEGVVEWLQNSLRNPEKRHAEG